MQATHIYQGIRIKGREMTLFVITHAHSFGTDTQHDYSQGRCVQNNVNYN